MVKVKKETRMFVEEQVDFLRIAEEMGVLDELSAEYPNEVELIRDIVNTKSE